MNPDPDLTQLLQTVHREVADEIGKGQVADYIPALAQVPPDKFGIAVFTCDQRWAIAGDAETPFSIQSISKIFTLSVALERLGANLWERVGREPSGTPFNSIVQLESERGIPRNPLINAGALVVTDTLMETRGADETIEDIVSLLRSLSADSNISVDKEVAASETKTGYRNASLANFIRAFDNITSPISELLRVYFAHCAITMNCKQLARAGLFLANEGVDPFTETRIVSAERAKRINAVMLTCGHYDASGDFAFRVGLPGKSGVGGGILAVVPHLASVAVWSPCLNKSGNSYAGSLALESLSGLTDWSIF
jgi:glutaminase